MCPLCGVSIEENDVEKHFEVELDKLINNRLLFYDYNLFLIRDQFVVNRL